MGLKLIFYRLWCFENNGSQLKNNVLYFTTIKFCACCNDVNIMLKENVKHVFTNFQIEKLFKSLCGVKFHENKRPNEDMYTGCPN